MKLNKSFRFSLIILLASVLFLSAVTSKDKKERKDKDTQTTISLWSFTDELEPVIDYFEEKYPDISVELSVIPIEDYQATLRYHLRKGDQTPDLFTGDAAYMAGFLNEGIFDNLEKAPYNVDTSSLVPYTVDMGRDPKTGAVSALTWQTTAGGFFYRRSIAKEVFGTDNPALIGEKIANMRTLISTGRSLKEKGYYLIPGLGDLKNTVMTQRTGPWIVDGELKIEKEMIDYFDYARIIRNEELDAGIDQWSPAWFDSMKRESKVFGQLFPTWGLHYIMKPNAPNSSGDWAVCPPPSDFFWGGTWIGVYKGSKKKEAAWQFIKMLCLDPDFSRWYAQETGDVLSNMPVVNKIKESFSDRYLAGQNHYAYFAEAAERIPRRNDPFYEREINVCYFNEVELYANGEKSKEQAIADFKAEVPKIIKAAKNSPKPELAVPVTPLKKGLSPAKKERLSKRAKKDFPPTTISVWGFTDELEIVIEYFEELYPEITIDFTVVPTEDYPSKLLPILRSGRGAPDVFTAEASFLKYFLDRGYYDNLESPPYNANVSSLVPYTVDLGRDTKTGAVSALSWQVCPGGFFYRRSIAKEVFGTDNPAVIGEKISTMEGFVEAGKQLKKKGYFIIPGNGDLSNTVMALRSEPWVVEGRLNLEDSLIEYFDIAKTIYQEELDAGIGQWSPAWFDSLKYNSNVFGQLLPTWGLHYVMKPNAPNSSGDWAVCRPPADFYWGGSWIGVYRGSKKKEAAWEFVKLICLDPEFSEWWASETGDVISNMSVAKKIKGTFSDAYLGGQNHYDYFYRAAQGVNGNLFTSYDRNLNAMYFHQVNLYVTGEKSKYRAIMDFKEEVFATYPDILVDF